MHVARIARLVGLVALVGCSDDPNSITPPENVARPARMQVEQLVPVFDEVVRGRLSTRVTADALERRFAAEAKRPWNDRLDGGIKYADLFVELYGARDWTLQFVDADGLTQRGAQIVAYLEATPAEALDPKPYHVARIAELTTRLEQTPKRTWRFRLDGDEAENAVAWLEADAARNTTELIDDVVDPESNLSARLASEAQEYTDQIQPRIETIAELEARIADGALRVARDLRHGNYKRLSWGELSRRGGGKAVVYDRLRRTFDQLVTHTDGNVGDVLRELRPPHPQYDRLLEALRLYRSFRDTGWSPVAPFPVELGTTHERVPQLRERLFAEGFADSADGSTTVDEALIEAVHAYQTAHQFRPGPPTPGFWRSLNIDLDRRIRQIELTLSKWRETNFRGEPDYVFVNIPDFHGEVYRNGERRRRFRVVVGNNNRVCDPETNTWHYPNATPVQWANLDHLMLNPWWNVPPRIYEEEIAEHAEDPEWLTEKGYELWEDDGEVRARQRPGEGNALGKVKFIFPNPHNTYMHDTPQKQYFEYPVRAFSHGCVRVHEPMQLAEYFMEEYEMGGRERLDRIMELGSTIKLEFDAEIPVFFEYYTVRVDDDGQTMFLADPYRLDRVALADAPSEVTTCSPTIEDETEDEETDEVVPEGVDTDVGP